MWVPFTGSACLLLVASMCSGLSSRSQELRYPPERIAVIGAGIGGTSAAYFLRQKFGKDVLIDVFERGTVGGRLATVNLKGEDYEAEGTSIHPLNLHMKHFVKELGIPGPKRQGGLMGIFNGDEFVFEESSWYIWNFIKLLWHYGLNPLRMHMWIEEILDKFMRIYQYQAHDYAFSSIESLLHALGGVELLQMLNQTIDESMQKSGFSQKFINEVVAGVMREDFGQGTSINGFVGTLSLAGDDPGLWSVEGGNKRVCSGLLQTSKAQQISGTVISIEEKTRQNGRSGGIVKLYEVTYDSTSGLEREAYDIIMIATPLNHKSANITFLNFNPPIPEFSKPYQETVATFVHGQINASFFGYQHPSYFNLKHIVTVENSKLFINSMVTLYPVKIRKDALNPQIWKIFSPQPLTKEQMDLLFISYDATRVKTWLAYPHYSPPEKCPPLILHSRMYYQNSIECLASGMEMSAVSAQNAALLAYHRWYVNTDMIDQEDLHERLKTEL
ncbi:prenylcysteine oxidase 1-like [Heteronotia binoei]|uniref:prenylcysteine oxidase 1-like n=1 Tax=Heteronotia binoei TaxID=13085 RepID=UPI002930510A|nr:prenylcysteine oxidase 1-like [Heteronotia binoei]